MSKSLYIVDLFASIVQKVDAVLFHDRTDDPFHVYFDYGHYNEVTRNLTRKSTGTNSKVKRYPLIWLVMDFVEKLGAPDKDYYAELPDLQVLIAMSASDKISVAERYDKSFKPRLYPIYEELKEQIYQSGFFTVLDPDAIPHEKIDRPYWGGQDTAGGNGAANLFNDFIDAIQIRRLQLFVNEKNCL